MFAVVATRARQREGDEIGEHHVEDVLAHIAAEVHAEMQAERADAQGGLEVFEQLRQVRERRLLGRLVGSRDLAARPFPGE